MNPQRTARLAGFFYLMTFLTGAFAIASSGRLMVIGDPAATAANILAHESSLRLGIAAYLLVLACYLVVTAMFYELFSPAGRSLARTAACFSLVGCSVQALSCVLLAAPLVLLGGAPQLAALGSGQLQELSYASIQLYGPAYQFGFVYFGFYCLMTGGLILRSTFLPRVLGALMVAAGLGWLVFLWPPLARQLSPFVLLPGVIGEGSLTLWLLLRGVNAERWKEQAGAARSESMWRARSRRFSGSTRRPRRRRSRGTSEAQIFHRAPRRQRVRWAVHRLVPWES
jgi:hypothetical protein